MKTTIPVLLLCCAAVLSSSAQSLQTDATAPTVTVSSAAALAAIPATDDGYSVTEIGPNHRRWTRVCTLPGPRGHLVYETNSYIELQDGMYYVRQGPSGPEWAESKAEIEGFPGGAVARQGQYQMIFANDLATVGAIDAQTPAGRFRSHVIGLCYTDSSLQTNIWIAAAASCQGQIISPNQVLYPDALVGDGVSASVRYTYRLSGWEQDILIQDPASLVAPEAYGLDSSSPTLTLQVITEFLDPPVPALASRTIMTAEGAAFQDEEVDWGLLRLEHGKAFVSGHATDGEGISVTKRWIEADFRHLLVEEIPFSSLKKALLSKDQGASLKPRAESNRRLVSLKGLPILPTVKGDTQPMQVAAAPRPEATLLIDFSTILTTQSNLVFSSDSTYYIPGTSGAVNLNGTTTLEGGTVIKIASTNTAKLLVNGPLVCQTGPYRMAVLTSKNDTSVGQSISGASGNPTNTGAIYIDASASQTNAYSYLRVAYAATGLRGPNFTNGVWHCQFVQCGTAVESTASDPVRLRNVLLARCTNGVVTTGTFAGEHLTVDQCATLLSGAGSSGNLTNCLLTGVTNLGTLNLYSSPRLSTSNGVYQTVGAANYYLVNSSTNRQAGVTNINPTLLKDLRSRTTCPPLVMDGSNITATTTWSPLAQRITGTPDLGFAYDPLDYLCRQITVTSQTLILTNGVAVGFFGSTGFDMSGGNGTIVGQGRPEAMNRLVWYPAVQEQSTRLNNISTVDSLLFDTGQATSPKTIQLRFTELPMQGARQSLWPEPAYPYNQTTLTLKDCWLHALNISEAGFAFAPASTLTWTFQNNLVERSTLSLFDGWVNVSSDPDNPMYVANPLAANLYNNLFRRSTVSLTYNDAHMTNHPAWAVKDNLFDNTTLSFTGDGSYLTYVSRSNNGFYNTSTNQLQGTSNVVLTSLTYATGALGPWYIGSASPTLVNAGSRNATNAGLFHYTILTSQVKETNTVVDLSFHYIAVDANGSPIDTDGDGLADYLEDANGNGALNTGETDWTNPDTDYDGRSDGQEIADGTNPLDFNSYQPVRLGYWRFDNPNTWAGEQGQVPLSATNISATPSWSTNAVLIHNTNGAVLRYRDVETNGLANIACRRGTVRFWFRPDWSSTDAGGVGPGSLGRFLELGTCTSSNGWWGLVVSADGSQLMFGTQTNSLAQTNLSAAISWSFAEWYQIVLVYTSTNSALYINGALATNGAGVAYYPKLAERASSGLRIGSDQNGGNQAAGAIDELETFNYPLDAASIQSSYQTIITADSDADNLPDFWEQCWFGNLDHSGGEFDAYGYTLLSDYENGRDPNVILFSVGVTNYYINTNSAALQLAVTAGVPSYMAILVNSTNFAAAQWQAYTADFTVPLGPTDGVYNVWIGLRGWNPNSHQTWNWTKLRRDLEAPSITITLPAALTVTQPMIDLRGYCPERLLNLYYDVANAAGTVSNIQGFITDQYLDPVSSDFTTNWFLCADLELTNGDNTVTLRATDLAGNVSTTVVTYTLNLSAANPPVLSLYWPQDGEKVCGDQFTLRGRLDDPTATVTAQISDAAGNVNLLKGLVERNGLV